MQKLVPPPPEAFPSSDEFPREPAIAASQPAEKWIELTWRQLESTLLSEDGWNGLAAYLQDEFQYLFFWHYAGSGGFDAFRKEDPEWIDFDTQLRAWRPPPTFAFIYTSENECDRQASRRPLSSMRPRQESNCAP